MPGRNSIVGCIGDAGLPGMPIRPGCDPRAFHAEAPSDEAPQGERQDMFAISGKAPGRVGPAGRLTKAANGPFLERYGPR